MARYFNTVSNWLGDTATLGFTVPFAVAAWVNMDVAQQGCVLGRINSVNRNKYAMLYLDSTGRPAGKITDNSTTISIAQAAAMTINEWHHLLLIVAGADQRLYQDGGNRVNRTDTLPSGFAMSETTIGARKNGASSATDDFHGSIAEVALWNLDDGLDGNLWFNDAFSDEIAEALYKRAISPIEVYPYQLCGYWSLMEGDLQSWTLSTNGANSVMGVTGSPSITDHPPLSRPTRSRGHRSYFARRLQLTRNRGILAGGGF